MRTAAIILATLLVASPSRADEVWTTERGDIVYLEDIGDIAHWVFTTKDVTYDIFLSGLGGKTEGRGVFAGYFLVKGGDLCGIEMKGPAGWNSSHWGEVVVDFYEPSFPSGFSFYRGECSVPANHGEALIAEPKTAQAEQSWQSERGEITYLQDSGMIAHWQLVTPDRQTYDLYLQGAGGKPQQGLYQGYWLDKENAEGCQAEMIGAEGWSSQNWGEVAFDFDEAGSPGVITVYLNNCFGSALDRDTFLAKPVLP